MNTKPNGLHSRGTLVAERDGVTAHGAMSAPDPRDEPLNVEFSPEDRERINAARLAIAGNRNDLNARGQ